MVALLVMHKTPHAKEYIMNTKLIITGIVATSLMATLPISPASAHEFHHHGGGHGGHGDGLLFGLVGGVVTAAALIATAPVRILADAAEPAQPVYAEPQPQAYYAQPGYGYYRPYPHRTVVYAYPPAYAYPAQTYAAPPPQYYEGYPQ